MAKKKEIVELPAFLQSLSFPVENETKNILFGELYNMLPRVMGNKIANNYSFLRFSYCYLIYIDERGYAWSTQLFHNINNSVRGSRYNPSGSLIAYKNSNEIAKNERIMLSCWKRMSNPYVAGETITLNSNEELNAILENHLPYWKPWAEKNHMFYDILPMLLHPELEILVKAGYKFAENMLKCYGWKNGDEKRYATLCRNGNNPKEIFKCSPMLFRALKNERSLKVWDSFRKMEKKTVVSKDMVEGLLDLNLRPEEMATVYNVIRQTYDGKPLFTWTSLLNYLNRLDMYQAIGRDEALILLQDYLMMCKQLKIKPRVDSDSLKREHDVTARLIRQKKNEALAKKMQGACDRMQDLNYTEDVFFIRGIRDYDDLIDEAKQQRNCVASYAPGIASGDTQIFVMREKSHPDKSLITVEYRSGKIRQKYLACNKPIHSKAQSDFLNRWLKYANAKIAIKKAV